MLTSDTWLQVQSGQACNLATFKAVWSSLSFSFIHQVRLGSVACNAASHGQIITIMNCNPTASACHHLTQQGYLIQSKSLGYYTWPHQRNVK